MSKYKPMTFQNCDPSLGHHLCHLFVFCTCQTVLETHNYHRPFWYLVNVSNKQKIVDDPRAHNFFRSVQFLNAKILQTESPAS